MRTNEPCLLHWCTLLAVVGTLACSGKLAVLKERAPGEYGSDTPSADGSEADGSEPSSADGSAPPARSGSADPAAQYAEAHALSRCPELAVSPLYPIPRPSVECGHCSCEDGQVSCSERACPQPKTIARCPEHVETVPDAVITDAMIRGKTLSINVRGYGGCGDVDLQPCYIQPALSSYASQSAYPKQATIRVLNPTTPSDCNEVVFQHLELGLGSLVEFRSDQGNLVDSNLGMVALGELSCEDAGLFSNDQYFRDISRLQYAHEDFRACDTDADCALVDVAFTCSQLCGGGDVINQAYASELRAESQRIDGEVCAPIAQSCSAAPATPQPCPTVTEHAFCDLRTHSCGHSP